MSWSVREAKARFSELLNVCVKEGPQIVTKRGVETVVVVPIEEMARLTATGAADPQGSVARARAAF